MKNPILIVFSLFMLVFASCDIIEPPFVEGDINPTPGGCVASDACLSQIPSDPFADGVPLYKNVLLEEFTGHRCGNCPTASEVALRLRDQTLAGDLFLVTIHAGGLAVFDSAADKFNVNYTTEAGDEYFDYFLPADAVPFGLLNRTQPSSGFFIYLQSQWESKATEFTQETAEVGIRVTPCYSAETRELVTVVDMKFVADVTNREHLSLFLIEDNVVGWQKDYRNSGDDENVADYKHHDMFRAAMNGTWGELLSDEIILTDESFRVTNCFSIPDYINADNAKVVAFVHNFDTREIRQVEVAAVN